MMGHWLTDPPRVRLGSALAVVVIVVGLLVVWWWVRGW